MANDVTLDDVARASGVSMAAASRALNGKEGVRPDVRDRVRLVAEALDYRPNRAAQNLAGGSASVIGLLLGSHDLRTDVYAASLLQALANAADSHDEGLMLLGDSLAPSVAVRNLISDGLVGGVIISAVALGEAWVEELLDAKVPTVLLGAHPRRSDVCVVDVENSDSSATVVGHMLDSGCQRVATITGHLSRVDASLRLQGYELAHTSRGLPVDPGCIFEADFSRASGYLLADKILATEPDAVFCANDEMALGVHKRLVELGVQVPADISLAGFDHTSEIEFDGPKLTSIAQPFDQLAVTAIETLNALVQKEQPPLEQLVAPKIFWGETTHPREMTSPRAAMP